MVTIMASYYLLYLPAFLESFFSYDPTTKRYFEIVLITVWFCNAQINPLLYYITNNDFKNAYWALLKLKSQGQIDTKILMETSMTQVHAITHVKPLE